MIQWWNSLDTFARIYAFIAIPSTLVLIVQTILLMIGLNDGDDGLDLTDNGITDTPVCMAAKAHLRSDRPLLITLASNDALSANLRNIGTLLSRKSVFFTPMVQDDPVSKPHSLVADFSLVPEALEAAMEGRQLRPIFLK